MPRITKQSPASTESGGGTPGGGEARVGQPIGLGGDDLILQLVARTPAHLPSDATLRTVAQAMAAESIGAVLLTGPQALVGIVSERDVVRALADGADPDRQLAQEIMTSELASVTATDTILAAAHRMLAHDIRHLAVTKGSAVVGVVSIRDVLTVLADRAADAGPEGAAL